MTEKLLSISEAKTYLNVSRATIDRWQAKGLLHPIYTPGGRRRFKESNLRAVMGLDDLSDPKPRQRAIIYARVPSQAQADAGKLWQQTERLVVHAVKQEYQIVSILTEIAASLDEQQPQLRQALQLIRDAQADILIVESRYRLTSFNFETLDSLVSTHEGRIEELTTIDESPQEEMMEELLAIMASFNNRIYGQRGQSITQQVSQTLKEALHLKHYDG